MKISLTTLDEKKWIKRVQKALNSCPSNRIGFYTIGDDEISLYDKDKYVDDINDKDNNDLCVTVDNLNANLGFLEFPSNIHAIAG